MPGQATPPVRGPRLNPFAFPSDTTLRFVLLVIFVICGSARLWGYFQVPDPAVLECASRDEALALAAEIPTLPMGGKIEVRPMQRIIPGTRIR